MTRLKRKLNREEYELPLSDNQTLLFIPPENLKADKANNYHLIKGFKNDKGKVTRLGDRTLCTHQNPKNTHDPSLALQLQMDEDQARINSAKKYDKDSFNICGMCVARMYAKLE
jgi:hypothetical protein